MNKVKIVVPSGIRYISEWSDLSLPDYPCIINKQLTGCGFTEYCLCNSENVILCSPRRILLENKEEQHSGDVLYVRNEYDKVLGVDKDITTIEKLTTKDNDDKNEHGTFEYYDNLKNQIKMYYYQCRHNQVPCKILVTYDSFKYVKEALMDVLSLFRVVVDEFQSIFTDSKFKSSTEIELLSHLYGIQKLWFVSATPMIDTYLEMLDSFKDLPYLELDWETTDPGRTIKPQLSIKSCKSILSEAYGIIGDYKSGHYDKSSWKDKDTGRICEVESREAVLYFNSVKNICDIIKKCKLSLSECNVLCSRTPGNEKKIRKAFGISLRDKTVEAIGKVPKRGQPHKMFTLCTRTVYLGADFYSTCAQTFIFSDANIDCLAVDITLDLPQILGRQRLIENPWKNCARLFYKVLNDKNIVTAEDFRHRLEEKVEETKALLRTYSGAIESDKEATRRKYLKDINSSNYKDDYVAIDSDMPVFNNLVMVAEMRAFDIQQVDYKDRFTVFATLDGNSYGLEKNKVDALVDEFDKTTQFIDKMKLVCENSLSDEEQLRFIDRIPKVFKNYYITLGKDKCKALNYQKSKMEAEYSRLCGNQGIDIESMIYSAFEEGQRYTKVYIKDKLKDIYESANYSASPKASDLENYFELKLCKVTNSSTGGRDMGFLIINKKD